LEIIVERQWWTHLGSFAVWGGMLLRSSAPCSWSAFREGILWGLGVIFLPFVALVYLILDWPTAKKPFFIWLWGVAFLLAGVFLLSAPLPFLHSHH
jgi:hypothetical protein